MSKLTIFSGEESHILEFLRLNCPFRALNVEFWHGNSNIYTFDGLKFDIFLRILPKKLKLVD